MILTLGFHTWKLWWVVWGVDIASRLLKAAQGVLIPAVEGARVGLTTLMTMTEWSGIRTSGLKGRSRRSLFPAGSWPGPRPAPHRPASQSPDTKQNRCLSRKWPSNWAEDKGECSRRQGRWTGKH